MDLHVAFYMLVVFMIQVHIQRNWVSNAEIWSELRSGCNGLGPGTQKSQTTYKKHNYISPHSYQHMLGLGIYPTCSHPLPPAATHCRPPPLNATRCQTLLPDLAAIRCNPLPPATTRLVAPRGGSIGPSIGIYIEYIVYIYIYIYICNNMFIFWHIFGIIWHIFCIYIYIYPTYSHPLPPAATHCKPPPLNATRCQTLLPDLAAIRCNPLPPATTRLVAPRGGSIGPSIGPSIGIYIYIYIYIEYIGYIYIYICNNMFIFWHIFGIIWHIFCIYIYIYIYISYI